ncbi:hypothetical protein Tco_0239589 [Tanacetum coccineum]
MVSAVVVLTAGVGWQRRRGVAAAEKGGSGDDVWRGCDGLVVMAAVAGQPCRRRWRRVAASRYGDRVDRVMRITFGFGRNARRKTFPAAAAWWPAAAAGGKGGRKFGEDGGGR